MSVFDLFQTIHVEGPNPEALVRLIGNSLQQSADRLFFEDNVGFIETAKAAKPTLAIRVYDQERLTHVLSAPIPFEAKKELPEEALHAKAAGADDRVVTVDMRSVPPEAVLGEARKLVAEFCDDLCSAAKKKPLLNGMEIALTFEGKRKVFKVSDATMVSKLHKFLHYVPEAEAPRSRKTGAAIPKRRIDPSPVSASAELLKPERSLLPREVLRGKPGKPTLH